MFLTGATISSETYQAVQRRVREGATCVLPPRLAPPGSGFEQISEITVVSDNGGRWVVVPDFYRLHYESFYGGPASALLRETLKPQVGSGDHLVYQFGHWITRFGQAGGDYPRHEIMTCHVPLTQAGANPDKLEVEVTTQ
jgi:hypothetical protein